MDALAMAHPALMAPQARMPNYPRPPQFGGGPVQNPGQRFLGPPQHPGGGGPQFQGGPVQMPLEHALALVGQKHPDLPYKTRQQQGHGQLPPELAPFAPVQSPLEQMIAALLAASHGN